MITKFFKPKRLPPANLNELNQEKLPLFDAQALISLLKLHNKIRSIKRLTALGASEFESLYQPVIDHYLECCQLIPASGSYHHTMPGGLITHTLNVVEYALQERFNYLLPQFSDPEVQQYERHTWTYAVFIAAIMHDVGKILTQQRLVLSNKSIFNPFNPVFDPSLTYRLEFLKLDNSYRLHKQVASIFFGRLIPQRGQIWLSQQENLHILDELTALIQGNHVNSGTIGRIVGIADSKSVAESIGLSKTERFLGATPPLSEKIIMAIRQIVPTLGINVPSSAVFKKDNVVWILPKILADSVRDYLRNHNESVPGDNNRIFDELQQSNFAISTEVGLVQRIQVQIQDWSQNFTAIGFDVRKIYDPTNLPKDLQGTITIGAILPVVEKTKEDGATSSGAENKNTEAIFTNEPMTIHDGPIDEDGTNTQSMDPWQLPPPTANNTVEPNIDRKENETEFTYADLESEAILGKTTEDAPNLYSEYETDTDDEETHEHIEDGTNVQLWKQVPLPPMPSNQSLNSREAGQIFIKWLQLMLKHRRYEINDKKSPVHKVHPDYLGLITPKIFLDFSDDYELHKTADGPHNKIRNGVMKTGLLLTHSKNKQIFPARVVNQEAIIYFCLVPEKHILDDTINISVNNTLILQNKPL